MDSEAYEKLLNEILQGLVTQLNQQIAGAIQGAGYDPYPNVTSDSVDIGVGTASYSVTNLTGISSLQIQSMIVSNVSISGTDATGQLALSASFSQSLSMDISGGVKVLFVHPSISGNISFTNGTMSGSALVNASTSSGQLCLNSIEGLNTNFNFSQAPISIDGLGALNDALAPLEQVVTTATHGAICALISSNINSILSQKLSGYLPQCISF